MEKQIKSDLEMLVPGRVDFEAPLAPLTTFGIGGPADALLEVESVVELIGVVEYLEKAGLPWFVLGKGSNILFKDGGFQGVIIKLGPAMAEITVVDEEGDLVEIECAAAASISALLICCQEKGFSGLEFLAGIPGSLGGALAMNAGAFGGEISRPLISLTMLSGQRQIMTVPRKQITAEYRRLHLPEKSIILSARFQLSKTDPESVKGRISRFIRRRKETQPSGKKTVGSIFKNPENEFAGRLIEQAGLKGQKMGRACVSEMHANFIVHEGGARASEIIGLMDKIRTQVKKRFGVELEPEIQIIGRNGENP